MPTYRYALLDVFAERPLTGNQLAVYTDARGMPEDLMQDVAREMNLSETVFVLPKEGEGHARIRIFTPARELPFAGHPTLGAAFVLGAPLELPEIHLETGAGVVPVTFERDASGRLSFGRMVQPVPTWEPYPAADELVKALGVDAATLPVVVYDNGMRHVMVCVASPDEVAAAAPDQAALAALPGLEGAVVAAGGGGAWTARVFLPWIGIAEDPATGSAAGPLVVHAARHGGAPFGEDVEIAQGAELKRPSKLYARVDGEGDRIDRVEVGGSAVVVARGELRLP